MAEVHSPGDLVEAWSGVIAAGSGFRRRDAVSNEAAAVRRAAALSEVFGTRELGGQRSTSPPRLVLMSESHLSSNSTLMDARTRRRREHGDGPRGAVIARANVDGANAAAAAAATFAQAPPVTETIVQPSHEAIQTASTTTASDSATEPLSSTLATEPSSHLALPPAATEASTVSNASRESAMAVARKPVISSRATATAATTASTVDITASSIGVWSGVVDAVNRMPPPRLGALPPLRLGSSRHPVAAIEDTRERSGVTSTGADHEAAHSVEQAASSSGTRVVDVAPAHAGSAGRALAGTPSETALPANGPQSPQRGPLEPQPESLVHSGDAVSSPAADSSRPPPRRVDVDDRPLRGARGGLTHAGNAVDEFAAPTVATSDDSLPDDGGAWWDRYSPSRSPSPPSRGARRASTRASAPTARAGRGGAAADGNSDGRGRAASPPFRGGGRRRSTRPPWVAPDSDGGGELPLQSEAPHRTGNARAADATRAASSSDIAVRVTASVQRASVARLSRARAATSPSSPPAAAVVTAPRESAGAAHGGAVDRQLHRRRSGGSVGRSGAGDVPPSPPSRGRGGSDDRRAFTVAAQTREAQSTNSTGAEQGGSAAAAAEDFAVAAVGPARPKAGGRPWRTSSPVRVERQLEPAAARRVAARASFGREWLGMEREAAAAAVADAVAAAAADAANAEAEADRLAAALAEARTENTALNKSLAATVAANARVRSGIAVLSRSRAAIEGEGGLVAAVQARATAQEAVDALRSLTEQLAAARARAVERARCARGGGRRGAELRAALQVAATRAGNRIQVCQV